MTMDTVVERQIEQGTLTGVTGVGSSPYIKDPALQRQLEGPQVQIAEPVFPEYVTISKYGVRVRTKAIDLMKLKMVRNKFKLPETPTYEIKLPSGKVESVLMDEEAAQDNEVDKKRWATYQVKLNSAESEQNDRIVSTIFFLGTELMDPLSDDWMVEQELLGIDIPTHPQMRLAHFLVTETTKEEIQELLRCIMGKSGVTEREIAVAEDAFRGEVHR